MKIYNLCGNDGLAGGIYRLEFIGWSLSVGVYRCRAARGGLNFKIYVVCFDMLFVLMRYAVGEGNFIEDRLCGAVVATACALYAGLVASGRELRGRLCGTCCCGSSNSGEVKQ